MAESDRHRRLFTVIMDFEGTTSASQFRTRSVEDAIRLWLKGLTRPGIYGLTERQRKRLAGGFNDFDLDLAPSPLTGLQSIWFSAASAKKKGVAVLNIIETVDNRSKMRRVE
jgi:hypothetical protein